MLKIIIELHPFGDATKKTTIAEMDLWNTGTGSPALGNYEGHALTHPSPWKQHPERRGGQVIEHPRNAPLWSLVSKMLHSMGYDHAA